jgi:Terminase RNaseH-like domain
MFYLGLDLGKKHDHTAIAIVEKYGERLLLARYLERVALGTPYTGVVARIREIVQRPGPWAVVVDGTGVGEPIMDSLRRAGLGCEIAAVTITGGERQSQAGQVYSVPKQDLIAGVQMAMENGELRVARRLGEAGALVKEMLNVRITAGLAMGKVRIGADGHGEHDDLVIALALACWRARRRENGFGGQRLPGYKTEKH